MSWEEENDVSLVGTRVDGEETYAVDNVVHDTPAVDILHNVNLPDGGPISAILSEIATNGPECGPVAETVGSRHTGDFDTAFDPHLASSRSHEIVSGRLDPG